VQLGAVFTLSAAHAQTHMRQRPGFARHQVKYIVEVKVSIDQFHSVAGKRTRRSKALCQPTMINQAMDVRLHETATDKTTPDT
jgi:hypothetical protein